MRIAMRLLSCVTFIAALIATPLPVRAQATTDEAAIRAIVAEQVVAWDAGDGTRYARHLAPEAARRQGDARRHCRAARRGREDTAHGGIRAAER
jgi:hypothetical protein